MIKAMVAEAQLPGERYDQNIIIACTVLNVLFFWYH